MISLEEIERLAKLRSEQGILSAYIQLDPRLRFVRRQPLLQFKAALKAAARRVQEARWRAALDRESAHVLHFLSNREPAGRGLVIFSCRPERIWEVLPLNVLVPSFVDVDSSTKTALLTETLEETPRFIVAVLQRDKARIYIASQGGLEQQASVASEVPGRHDQGGRSQMRFQRHIDFHAVEHLKAVVAELQRLTQGRPFKLALGGTEETVHELMSMLPEPIARGIIGRFPVDYKHDTEHDIFERAELVWKNQERLEEDELVNQVFDAAKSETRGVLGLEPTVSALVEERVRTLLVADGLTIEGFVCKRCDYFSAEPFQRCPLCGGDSERRDVVDRAVEKAILTGAETEVVASDRARDRLLAEGAAWRRC
jgi:peptide chain release factor subunit 1